MSDRWEILMVALIIGAAHLISPWVYARRKYAALQEAFGGGLSVAYVFLHLMPNLDAFGGLVGQRIYFVALVGFAVFYGLEVQFSGTRHANRARYNAYLATLFLYDALLVFTLGLKLPSTPTLTLVFAAALAFDVVNTDVGLQSNYGSRFVQSGRWVLLAGVAFGFGLGMVQRPDPVVVDLVTAALAGFVMFQTFNDQFPASRNTKFNAFAAGLVTFFLLHLLLGSAE